MHYGELFPLRWWCFDEIKCVLDFQKKTLDKAAEELGLGTPSAVQKRIKAANRFFDTTLFTNTGEGMALQRRDVPYIPMRSAQSSKHFSPRRKYLLSSS